MTRMMKKYLLVAMLIIGGLFTVTGCGGGSSSGGEAKKDLTTVSYSYPDLNGKFKVSYEKGSKIKFINSEKDGKDSLRTSSNQAGLLTDTWLISFQFKEYWTGKTFKTEQASAKKDKEQYKEVEYNGIKGYSWYYSSYNCYQIALPVDKECCLIIGVHYREADKVNTFNEWASNEKEAKKAFNNKTVKEILNTIEISKK